MDQHRAPSRVTPSTRLTHASTHPTRSEHPFDVPERTPEQGHRPGRPAPREHSIYFLHPRDLLERQRALLQRCRDQPHGPNRHAPSSRRTNPIQSSDQHRAPDRQTLSKGWICMLLIRNDFTAFWKLGPFQSSSKSGERSV